MESIETNEGAAFAIVIVLITILGFCIIDLVIDKLKPKKVHKAKKVENTKELEKATKKIEEILESIEQDEIRIQK